MQNAVTAPGGCAAIVLAAGASSRFGANKLLQPFGVGTVLGAVLAATLGSRARPVVVITGHDREAVEAAVGAVRAQHGAPRRLHNPDFAAGEMASSIKVGLAWLQANAPETKWVLIVPGDMPRLSAAILDAVLEAGAASDALIVAPRYRGERGHPVLLARAIWSDALALPPGAQMRALLGARASDVHLFDLDDAGVIVDVDTPDALRRARLGDWD